MSDSSAVLYTTNPLAELVRIEGPYVVDDKGHKAINFYTAIAVDSLGEGKAEILKALQTQLATGLCMTSPACRSAPLEEASTLLAQMFNGGQAKIFWCNSGAEANEASIKMMRAWHEIQGHKERDTIITFKGAFHGRSAETVAAAGNFTAIGMGNAQRSFIQVSFNDLGAVEAALDGRVAGILVEPVQGEGGIVPATQEFLRGLRALSDKHGILLAFDEVQCGMGRTGKVFAHQHYGVKPDLMSLGKALGGGVMPVAATVIDAKVERVLTQNGAKPFDHGSTFGGSPLATAVAVSALTLIQQEQYTGKDAERRAVFLREKLAELAGKHPEMMEPDIRGLGFFIGVRLEQDFNNLAVRQKLYENGLAVMGAKNNVLRLLPPLDVTEEIIQEAVACMDKTFEQLKAPTLFVSSAGAMMSAVNTKTAAR